MTLPEGARCARHAELDASAVCARCGDFVCERCVRARVDGGAYCARCEAVAGEPFVWERRGELGLPRAMWATTIGVLLRPRKTFAPGFRDRSVLPALGFGLAWATPVGLASAAIELAWPSDGRAEAAASDLFGLEWVYRDEVVLAMGLASPLLFVVGVGLFAALYALGLMVVHRATRPFSHVVRTIAYVHGATAPLSLPGLAVPSGAWDLAIGACTLVLYGAALGSVMRAPTGRIVGASIVAMIGLALVIAVVAVALAAVLFARGVP